VSGAPIASLEELLGALARERSLRGRLRVLGHSWQLLRALSPMEREKVALRLGSKWAWKRVEKTFLRDGELSENEQLVGQAFARMGDADPRELRHLARTIREGDSASARDLLMLTLTEALEEEAEEDESEDAAPAEGAAGAPEAAGAAGAPEGEALLEPEALEQHGGVQDSPLPEAKLVESAAGVLDSSRAREVAPPEPRAAPRPQPVAPRAFPAPQPEPGHEEPPGHVAPALRSAPVRAAAAPTTPAPQPVPQPEPTRASAAAADHEPDHASPFIEPAVGGNGADRLRVLRALQRNERPGATLGRAGRAALLESLGGGWASRRALTRMIRTRSLDGLDEALGLIRELVRPGQQAWCLADLIAHWELAPEEHQRILEAAPTDAARRRLARRSAAAASGRG
jgi:outer membrane biosynthesis protein TonB